MTTEISEHFSQETTKSENPVDIASTVIDGRYTDDYGHVHFSRYADLLQEFQLAYLEKRGIAYPKLEETYGLLRYAREMHISFNNDVKEGDKVEIP